jgi:cytochrome c oxidase assembly factor CtaG
MLFCWPLAGPVPRYHIHPLQGVLYLFTACITCSLLGLLITFAPLGTYHHYLDMDAMMHSTGSGPWGLSRAADQQAAGLIMWVPCCFIYLAGCLLLLQRWFAGHTVNTLSATYD